MTPEERSRRRLARVGTGMIALGGAAVIVSVAKGALGGLSSPPGILIILLGVVFVAMSTGVDQGEFTVGNKRASFELKSRASEREREPDRLLAALDPPEVSAARQRRRRQCWVKRIRA